MQKLELQRSFESISIHWTRNSIDYWYIWTHLHWAGATRFLDNLPEKNDVQYRPHLLQATHLKTAV